MLKGAVHRRWVLQPSSYTFTKKPVMNLPYRCSSNSGPPVMQKLNTIKPVASLETPENIALSDKEKLKKDILSIRGIKSMTWKEFSELTKFKLSLMNTSVASIGYFMTNKCVYSDIYSLSLFLLATQMSAMSSQAMNQSIEVEHDKKMKRTSHRPLPSGKVTPAKATSISWGLLGASNVILYSMFGWQAGMMANAIFSSYILIYTPMKRKSEMNTVVGSLVGAVVPYLGWFAGGGAATSLTPFFMTLFMFAWQFPHFYGILWNYKDDYKRAGFKMLEDPKVAARHAKLAVAGYLASTIGLICTGDISIYLSIPAAYTFYKNGWKPAVEFEKNPTLENAKKMKYNSYGPWTIFMVAVLIGIAQRVYTDVYHKKFVEDVQDKVGVKEVNKEKKEEESAEVIEVLKS